MGEALITRSIEDAAAFTLEGEPSYVLVQSEKAVISASMPVGQSASTDAIAALRKRLREGH